MTYEKHLNVANGVVSVSVIPVDERGEHHGWEVLRAVDRVKGAAGMIGPDGAGQDLSPLEAAITQALLLRFGLSISKNAIMDYVYAERGDDAPMSKTVDVTLCRMRPKLKRVGLRIDTRHGYGWELRPC